jgi:hypothetical protein
VGFAERIEHCGSRVRVEGNEEDRECDAVPGEESWRICSAAPAMLGDAASLSVVRSCRFIGRRSWITALSMPKFHDEGLRSWLLRSGYHDHGISLGTETNPESFLLSCNGIPP